MKSFTNSTDSTLNHLRPVLYLITKIHVLCNRKYIRVAVAAK